MPGRMALSSSLLVLLSVLSCGVSVAQPVAAPSCQPAPQLQPGKTQLLERVLVRPGARLATKPDGADGVPVPAFSALFVYGRSPDGAAVQVGVSSDCKPQGWMRADSVVSWRHTMVAAFTPRSNRDRVLFFGSADAPKALLPLPDTTAEAARLHDAATKAPGTAGVVAQEPPTPVDIDKQFYLLPILDAQSLRFGTSLSPSNLPVDILHVASLSEKSPASDKSPASPAAATASAERHSFRTAVVFVLDATESMDPYLNRSRETLDKIFAKVEAEKLQDRVRFGLVAFRDDPKAVPRIEYGTRVYADPNRISSKAAFDQAVKGMRAATVSSRAVAEDVYAGMETAIDKVDWSGFDGKFVVLVTDASAREPDSGIVATNMDEGALALLAQEKGIALMAVHLLTKEGGDKDHERAERQYKVLTRFPGRGPLYYSVPAGDVNEFGKEADKIAAALVQLIESAEDNGGARPDAPPPPAPPSPSAAKTDPAADIAAVGYAMRLAYLGKVAGSAAPAMFESWALDKDLAHHDVQSLDIRVLMSKAQLSDLAATVSALNDAMQKGIADPDSFERQLRSALLTLSRDPNKIGSNANRELTDAALGEYVAGLPFRSKVMGLTQDAWLGMSPSEQQELIDHLAVDLELYQHMQDDVGHWVSLAPGARPEDAVYPVPLNAFP
nr:VWA domain-containing protein [uncultured Rhodopila sp.]